jgi:hypothetical protein
VRAGLPLVGIAEPISTGIDGFAAGPSVGAHSDPGQRPRPPLAAFISAEARGAAAVDGDRRRWLDESFEDVTSRSPFIDGGASLDSVTALPQRDNRRRPRRLETMGWRVAPRAWPDPLKMVRKPTLVFLERREAAGTLTADQYGALARLRLGQSSEPGRSSTAPSTVATPIATEPPQAILATSRLPPSSVVVSVVVAALRPPPPRIRFADPLVSEELAVEYPCLADETVSGTAIRPVAPSELQAGYVVLLMVYMLGSQPLVLTYPDAARVPAAPADAVGDEPAVHVAEQWATQLMSAPRRLLGYLVGTSAERARVVVVPTARAPPESRVATSRSSVLWCSLALLAGSGSTYAIAGLAVARSAAFSAFDAALQPHVRADAALQQASGFAAGRSDELVAPRPQLLQVLDAPQPSGRITEVDSSLVQLRDALVNYEGPHRAHVRGWLDSIQPSDLSEVPPDLLDSPVPVRDPALDMKLFAPRLPVHVLPWLPRMPQPPLSSRPECANFRASDASDLLTATAVTSVQTWVNSVRCIPLDHQAHHSTRFHLPYLRTKFKHYPDQRLASHVLEGVRFEADLELQIVLSPPLVSLPAGIESVQTTVRELRAKGFYRFLPLLPYAPIRVVSQGSALKKNGKHRRTSDMGSPRRRLIDGQGKVALSVNAATRTYAVPDWIRQSPSQELRDWDERRYAHVPNELIQPMAGEEGAISSAAMPVYPKGAAALRHKYPKEGKPTIEDVMIDGSLFGRASYLLGEPIFVWVNDAAFYFNQFGYSPEDLFKSNLVIVSRAGDQYEDGTPIEPGTVVFVSELRIGFGAFASSNIAQRFSNAYTSWILEEFDRLEVEAFRHASPAWQRWVETRRPLEAKCRTERKPRPGEAPPDSVQTRLATIHMYQDDPVYIVVGVARALRLLVAAQTVTESIGLEMADASKRQMGTQATWIGVVVLIAFGWVVVPRAKLLRAHHALGRAVRGELCFSEYRALLGLFAFHRSPGGSCQRCALHTARCTWAWGDGRRYSGGRLGTHVREASGVARDRSAVCGSRCHAGVCGDDRAAAPCRSSGHGRHFGRCWRRCGYPRHRWLHAWPLLAH